MEVGTDFNANLWKFNGSWRIFFDLTSMKIHGSECCPTSTVSDFHAANVEVGLLNNRYGSSMEDRFDFTEDRINFMEDRFDFMEARFDFMEDRFDFMEVRFDFVEVGRAFSWKIDVLPWINF